MNAILAAAPALPLHSAGKYVAGAYIVFVVALVIYLGIMAIRLGHTQRELQELKQEVEEREAASERNEDLEAGREPGRPSEAGGRAMVSARGAGGPAEDSL